jgi:hypothetical protein
VAPKPSILEADECSVDSKNLTDYEEFSLDYSALTREELVEADAWWKKNKGTTGQKIEQLQRTKGFFPKNPQLYLYGFGLPEPGPGQRVRWNIRTQERVDEVKKGWKLHSFDDQQGFEEELRLTKCISPISRRSGPSSQPSSAIASPHLPSTSSLPKVGPSVSPLISTTAAPSVTPPQEHSDNEDDNGETLDFHTPAPPGPERRAGPSFELGLTTEASETTLNAGRQTPPPPDPSLPPSSDEDDTMATQPTVALKNTAKVNPPHDFNGDVANTNNFIREVKLYKRLKPDDFSDDDGWLYWALSYMRGSKFVPNWHMSGIF